MCCWRFCNGISVRFSFKGHYKYYHEDWDNSRDESSGGQPGGVDAG